MKPDKYHSISGRARILKVSVSHLSRCLKGLRPWYDLKKRYDDLVEAQRRADEVDEELKAAKAQIPFADYFTFIDAEPVKIREAVAELGDAVFIVNGQHIVFDATRVGLPRPHPHSEGSEVVFKGEASPTAPASDSK